MQDFKIPDARIGVKNKRNGCFAGDPAFAEK